GQLREVLHLDLERYVGRARARAAYGRGEPAGGCDVVFLDQHRVEETDAMVGAPAARHGVLLGSPQPGQRLASVEQPRLSSGEQRNGMPRGSGGAGQQLQEGERRAHARDDAARRSAKLADDRVRGYLSAVGGAPRNRDAAVDLTKDFIEPRTAADGCGL